MKKMLTKIYRWFNPLYQVVYTTKDGRTEMYTIAKPQHIHEFGNMNEVFDMDKGQLKISA